MAGRTVSSARHPVAIGGLGGSGTRVVAAMVAELGFDLGTCLNRALDNLWFTVLFKRRDWVEHGAPADEVDQAIGLFVDAMTTGLAGRLDAAERALIERLGAALPPDGEWIVGARTEHALDLLSSVAPSAPSRAWGWKEPNTHVFLSELDTAIDGLRYVHVIRDPLDMAFSSTTWQLNHWAPQFGVTRRRSVADAQLRYWIAANRRAVTYGEQEMGDRFRVVLYDDLCRRPGEYWPWLGRFLGADSSIALPDGLLAPTSIGRSADHDLSVFDERDVAAAFDLVEAARRTAPA